MLGRRWAGVPRSVRVVVGAGALVLSYGGIVHVVQLVAAEGRPYAWAPTWLAVYFTSLTLLDPLAAVLLWCRRVAGLYLAVGVLATDALANAYAVYGLPGATATARISQGVVTCLAITAVIVAPRLRGWLTPAAARTT